MPKGLITHGGPSYVDLEAARRSDHLFVLVQPLPENAGMRSFVIRITQLAHRGDPFVVGGVTLDGHAIQLIGHRGRDLDQSCTFEIVSIA